MNDTIIRDAVADLLGGQPVATVSEHRAQAVIAQAVHRARQLAEGDPGTRLYSAGDVASVLGVSRRRVLALAQRRQVGFQVGREWVFQQREIAALQPGPLGRPPKAG